MARDARERMSAAIVVLLTALVSWALTGLVRRYAECRLLDVPNARSSHQVATPRGGGLAIVVAFVVAMLALAMGGVLAWPLAVGALIVPGLLVALIGFLDDHGHVPAGWRLLVHVAAAAIALWTLAPLPALVLAGGRWEPGLVGAAIALVALVWLLNLFNFMDGIDGIAGGEALSVGLGGAVVAALALPGSTTWLPAACFAASAAGFLVWNAPPARIFMGDVGSGFLGLTAGVLALVAARDRPTLLWAWVILLAVFVSDATVTLVRRALRGERVLEAHRSHAYQHAARRLGAHRPVTLATVGLTLGWLLPLAALATLERLPAAWALLLAYGPLVPLALWLGAGRSEGPRGEPSQRSQAYSVDGRADAASGLDAADVDEQNRSPLA